MAKARETFAVTDRIQHSEYGLGKITGVNARHTTIEFDGAGVKKFVTGIVRLEHSDAPAPVKMSRGGRPKATRSA